MRSDSARALVERFWAAWNRRDWSAMQALVTADYAHHIVGQSTDWAGFRAAGERWLAAFPDWQVRIEGIATISPPAGERVVVAAVGTGTHRGEFLCFLPRGNRVCGPFTMTYRLVGGCIAEGWEESDFGALLAQLEPATAGA